jgi:crotonobetainyl-CoA:carnitine CoA-transferase CaiB-like acyl-CoA transferase
VIDARPGPLSGIRVVDLTIWMSGPIGSMLLGDLGAEVVKIESANGDATRMYVPIGQTRSSAASSGVNFAYAQCNRNKSQVVLNLTEDAGRDHFTSLIADADVFITNLQADTLRKIGADELSVKAINPAIIYARVCGLGHAGPLADYRCQDMLGMAYSGLLYTISPEEGEPFAPPGAINDVLTGTMTAFGVLAALMERDRDGGGQAVYTSLLHTALWTQLVQFGTVANAPEQLLPAKSRRNPRSPGVNQYKCADGRWLAVAAVTEDAWQQLVSAIGGEDLAPGRQIRDYSWVLVNASSVRQLLDDHFLLKPFSHWLDILQGNGIWSSEVKSLSSLIDDPQVAANGYLVDLDDGMKTVSMPFVLDGYAPPLRGGRQLGADNSRLKDLEDLAQRGAFQAEPGKAEESDS